MDGSNARISHIPEIEVRRLCAGQVIVDLPSIVKELLENSLDARANNVEIRCMQYGGKGVEVIDNGTGVPSSDHASLARKHHTSKLQHFADLETLTSFGFRGEALASLANVARLCVVTRTAADDTGYRLEFDHNGELSSSKPTAREVGTTATVTDVFCNLPVRQGEFLKNITREYSKLLSVLQGYALVCVGVRVSLFNTTATGKKQLVFASKGAPKMLDNVLAIFPKDAQGLESVTLDSGEDAEFAFRLEGVISSLHGGGRRLNDRQFFFVNQRPMDMSQLSRIATDCFRVSSGNEGKFPFVALNFTIPTDQVDINVTPDKRTIFFANQDKFLAAFRSILATHYNRVHSESTVVKPAPAKLLQGNNTVIPLHFPPATGIPRAPSVGFPVAAESRISSSPTTGSLLSPPPVSSSSSLSPSPVISLSTAPSPPHGNNNNNNNNVFGAFSFGSAAAGGLSSAPLSSSSSVAVVVSATSLAPVQDAVTVAPVPSGNIFGSFSFSRASSSTTPGALPKRSYSQVVQSVVSKAVLSQKRGLEVDDEDAAVAPGYIRVQDDMPVIREVVRTLSSQVHPGDDHQEEEDEVEIQSAPTELEVNFDLSVVEQQLQRRGVRVKRQKASQAPGPGAANPIDLTQLEVGATNFRKESFEKLRVIGQFNNGFIIAQLGDNDLYIIDQHASNEIYNFETLQQTTVLHTQRLLVPVTIELQPDEEMDVLTNMTVFEKNGFALRFDDDAPPGRKVRMLGRPESKDTVFGVEDVREILMLLRQHGHGAQVRPSRVRAMFASRACRMSIMIGDPLSQSQMQRIVKDLSSLQAPWACPHGRPTFRHLWRLE